jgi:hypothetical protein
MRSELENSRQPKYKKILPPKLGNEIILISYLISLLETR